jgi:hypothetical protein
VLKDFELTDQNLNPRVYHFPTKKVTVMTVSDHKGTEQLTPWIQNVYDRYQTRIEIDGIADVSMIPGTFHNFFRKAFRKKLTRSVLLDWKGDAVRQFGYKKGVANIYVIDRDGQILIHCSGPMTPTLLEELGGKVDEALR